MGNRQFLATIFRAIGLYLIVTRCLNLATVGYISWTTASNEIPVFLASLPSLALLILGVALARAPLAIVDILAPSRAQTDAPAPEIAGPQTDVPLLGVKLLGLYFIVSVASDVDGFIQAYHAFAQISTGAMNVSDFVMRYALGAIVQLIAGIWLLLGGAGVLHIVRRARTASMANS